MKDILVPALVNKLNKLGMNPAHLSDILDIPRLNIYHWKDGKSIPDGELTSKMFVLNTIVSALPPGHLRFYLRFWNRELEDSGTLKILLCSNPLDVKKVEHALEVLRPSVERAYVSDLKMKSNASKMPKSPASSLTEYLIAYSPLLP